MELEGKIALVTGAGQGIGKAIALTFAREGADVAVDDINIDTAEGTASEVKALGRRSMAIKADISIHDEVTRMMNKIIEEWGGIDILVNNAGIGNTRLVEDLTDEEWRHIFGVNLDGTFYCSKEVLETMKSRGGGRIINIASPAGKSMTRAACAAYTASKAGVLGFTRHLAFEVGPYKINVNAICGGALTEKSGPIPPPEVIQTMREKSILGNIMLPENIADVALFLASEKARMITGTSIDAYPVVPGNREYWESFVKTRKEALAKDEPAH